MERIAPARLSSSILDPLAGYIERTGLTEGDRLPPEREIAQQLGVSRPLVREALQHWRALGFVQTINGRGTFLRTSLAPDSQHVVLILNRERESLLHTLEIRRGLEPEAAALAAVRATDDQVARLEALIDAVEAAYRRVGDAPEEDWAFHQAVYEASGNPLFGQLINGIHNLFTASGRTRSTGRASPGAASSITARWSKRFAPATRRGRGRRPLISCGCWRRICRREPPAWR